MSLRYTVIIRKNGKQHLCTILGPSPNITGWNKKSFETSFTYPKLFDTRKAFLIEELLERNTCTSNSSSILLILNLKFLNNCIIYA